MSESTPVNVQAFEPFLGGGGARLSATTSSASVQIPGLEGGRQDDKSRVVISNSGSTPVYVRMGNSAVAATTASYEIMPGTKELLKPPNIGNQPVYLAAIMATGTGAVNVCAGVGTGCCPTPPSHWSMTRARPRPRCLA